MVSIATVPPRQTAASRDCGPVCLVGLPLAELAGRVARAAPSRRRRLALPCADRPRSSVDRAADFESAGGGSTPPGAMSTGLVHAGWRGPFVPPPNRSVDRRPRASLRQSPGAHISPPARLATRQAGFRDDPRASRQVPLSAPVGVHDVDVGLPSLPERDLLAIGRPERLRPVLRQPPRLAAVRIHDVDLEGRRSAAPATSTVFLSSDSALERDPPPVGRPGRSEVARPVARQPALPAAVGVHDPDASCFRRRSSGRRATRRGRCLAPCCASASAARCRRRS